MGPIAVELPLIVGLDDLEHDTHRSLDLAQADQRLQLSPRLAVGLDMNRPRPKDILFGEMKPCFP